MWRDEAVLLDIAQAARRIASFVQGVDEASFAANAEKHWAVVAQLYWRSRNAIVPRIQIFAPGNRVGKGRRNAQPSHPRL
jgi:hypothetical protein